MGMMFIIASRDGGLESTAPPIDERLIQASNIIVIRPDSPLANHSHPQDHNTEQDTKQVPQLHNEITTCNRLLVTPSVSEWLRKLP